MIKIDIFDKINNKLIVSFIKQILHRCSCKVISSYIRKFSTFQKEMFDNERATTSRTFWPIVAS